jgi:hypothetical protein
MQMWDMRVPTDPAARASLSYAAVWHARLLSSAAQRAYSHSLHPAHRAGFAASRTAAARALEAVTDSPAERCAITDRRDAGMIGCRLSLTHDNNFGGAVAWPSRSSARWAIDVVSVPRLQQLVARQPRFVPRWVPGADRDRIESVALQWGVRECCVKLIGDNKAFDMAGASVATPAAWQEEPQLLKCAVGHGGEQQLERAELRTPSLVTAAARVALVDPHTNTQLDDMIVVICGVQT